MILKPEAQLQIKRELVREALIKYAGLSRDKVQPVVASPSGLGYRIIASCRSGKKNGADW